MILCLEKTCYKGLGKAVNKSKDIFMEIILLDAKTTTFTFILFLLKNKLEAEVMPFEIISIHVYA